MSFYNLPELISLSELEDIPASPQLSLCNAQASRTTTLLPRPSTPGSSRAMWGMWANTELVSLNVAATQTEGTWKTHPGPHVFRAFPPDWSQPLGIHLPWSRSWLACSSLDTVQLVHRGCHESLWPVPRWNPHPRSRAFFWPTHTLQKKEVCLSGADSLQSAHSSFASRPQSSAPHLCKKLARGCCWAPLWTICHPLLPFPLKSKTLFFLPLWPSPSLCGPLGGLRWVSKLTWASLLSVTRWPAQGSVPPWALSGQVLLSQPSHSAQTGLPALRPPWMPHHLPPSAARPCYKSVLQVPS